MPGKYTIMITGEAADLDGVEKSAAAFAELLKEYGAIKRMNIRRETTPISTLAIEDAPAAASALASRMDDVAAKRAGEAAEEKRKKREKEEADRSAREASERRRADADAAQKAAETAAAERRKDDPEANLRAATSSNK